MSGDDQPSPQPSPRGRGGDVPLPSQRERIGEGAPAIESKDLEDAVLGFPSPQPSPAAAGEEVSTAGVASAALVIGLGNITSRLLGLARELVIAALFGATGATSAFRTATRVSTAVYDLLLSGATTSALVPVFSEYAAAGNVVELSRVVSTFVNLTITSLGLIVLALVVFA